MSQFLTVRQIADELACSPRFVERLVERGALPAIKDGPRFTRIARADLDAYLDEHRTTAPRRLRTA